MSKLNICQNWFHVKFGKVKTQIFPLSKKTHVIANVLISQNYFYSLTWPWMETTPDLRLLALLWQQFHEFVPLRFCFLSTAFCYTGEMGEMFYRRPQDLTLTFSFSTNFFSSVDSESELLATFFHFLILHKLSESRQIHSKTCQGSVSLVSALIWNDFHFETCFCWKNSIRKFVFIFRRTLFGIVINFGDFCLRNKLSI